MVLVVWLGLDGMLSETGGVSCNWGGAVLSETGSVSSNWGGAMLVAECWHRLVWCRPPHLEQLLLDQQF